MMGIIKDIAAIPNIGLKENHTMSTQNAYHFLERDQHLNFYRSVLIAKHS